MEVPKAVALDSLDQDLMQISKLESTLKNIFPARKSMNRYEMRNNKRKEHIDTNINEEPILVLTGDSIKKDKD